jgi:hypothetical protein
VKPDKTRLYDHPTSQVQTKNSFTEKTTISELAISVTSWFGGRKLDEEQANIGAGDALRCDLKASPKVSTTLATAAKFATLGAYGIDGVAFLIQKATCVGCKDKVVGPVFNFNSGTVVLVDEGEAELAREAFLAMTLPPTSGSELESAIGADH